MEMKDRIQDKAHELFCSYGIKSITMDEIAAQLGVSKKTIYQYFSDKDELVDVVAKKLIRYSQTVCDEQRGESKDAIHEIFQAMDLMQEIFSNMNPSMLFDLERFHHRSYKAFLEHKNKYLYQVIRKNLERGIEEELYRPEIDVEIITRYRLEGMLVLFNTQVFTPGKFTLTNLHKQIAEHFVFGIVSLKGYKLVLKYQQELQKRKV